MPSSVSSSSRLRTGNPSENGFRLQSPLLLQFRCLPSPDIRDKPLNLHKSRVYEHFAGDFHGGAFLKENEREAAPDSKITVRVKPLFAKVILTCFCTESC